MYYVSTRDASLRYTAAQAIVQGLSREGGLFLPSEIPQLSREDLTELTRCSYPERAAHIMGLYLDDFSQEELLGFAEKAYGPAKFDTPAAAPVVKTEDGAYVMELWHGPTCAFKDMALQMLPYLLTASLRKTGEQKTDVYKRQRLFSGGDRRGAQGHRRGGAARGGHCAAGAARDGIEVRRGWNEP